MIQNHFYYQKEFELLHINVVNYLKNVFISDATKKIRFPVLLDMILFDAVISKMYILTRPGKTPEDISK